MRSSFRARLTRAIIIAAAVGCVLGVALAEVTVKPKVIEVGPFEVMGIEVRTNNAKEAGADGLIPTLWDRVAQEHALDAVPGRIGQDIYAVYTDYASDANGDYTLLIGAKFKPTADTQVPKGMVVKTVPASRYAVFTSARGPVAKVVCRKPGSRSGRTTDCPPMVSGPTAPILKCTISAPPIPTTHKWTSTSE